MQEQETEVLFRIKHAPNKPLQVRQEIVRDRNISAAAVGLYVFIEYQIVYNPDGGVAEIINRFQDKEIIKAAFEQLIAGKYIQMEDLADERDILTAQTLIQLK